MKYRKKEAGAKESTTAPTTPRGARKLVEEIYAGDLDLLEYEFEDETETSVPVSLYDMDKLKKQREKIYSEVGEIEFKIYMIRFYLGYKHKLLGVVTKTPVLNYVYEMLYSPLKFRVLGKPLPYK